ncbi:nucleotidyltransferase family protein [uncultured Olsenella sp.]|uniref:nucleotidyltransferase family protein n=1 Tax=uncultured Olsenella sp. TaxID=190764 RepID=UPI0026DB1EB2|nr:nucleotidyltransferase domain-containing protein [uncultured Olsenella sp.]
MSEPLSRDEITQIIRPILRRYHASGAALFGSYARGEATQDSDIDLIIYGGPDFDRTDIFSIAEELFEASGKRVDVYEASELNPASDFYSSVKHDEVRVA